eukprot:768392-Hanusia_phi.AAC.17
MPKTSHQVSLKLEVPSDVMDGDLTELNRVSYAAVEEGDMNLFCDDANGPQHLDSLKILFLSFTLVSYSLSVVNAEKDLDIAGAWFCAAAVPSSSARFIIIKVSVSERKCITGVHLLYRLVGCPKSRGHSPHDAHEGRGGLARDLNYEAGKPSGGIGINIYVCTQGLYHLKSNLETGMASLPWSERSLLIVACVSLA